MEAMEQQELESPDLTHNVATNEGFDFALYPLIQLEVDGIVDMNKVWKPIVANEVFLGGLWGLL